MCWRDDCVSWQPHKEEGGGPKGSGDCSPSPTSLKHIFPFVTNSCVFLIMAATYSLCCFPKWNKNEFCCKVFITSHKETDDLVGSECALKSLIHMRHSPDSWAPTPMWGNHPSWQTAEGHVGPLLSCWKTAPAWAAFRSRKKKASCEGSGCRKETPPGSSAAFVYMFSSINMVS